MNSLLHLHYLLPLLSTFLALLVFTFYFYKSKKKKPNNHKSKICTAPEAGGAWPVIGHLHQLGGQELTHKLIGTMADKYGPIFTIRLGSYQTLVINSWEIAKECFTTHDLIFSDRTSIAATRLLGYNLAMFAFAPYGAYWRELRKIATIELFSNRRIDMFQHIRTVEVETSLRGLYKTWVARDSPKGGVLVDVSQWLLDLTQNISVRLVAGKRYFGADAYCDEKEARTYQRVIREYAQLFGVFVISDAFPALGWLDLGGYEKRMKRAAKELDVLIQGWLEEHKQKRLLSGKNRVDQDFMDVMLTMLEDAKFADFDNDTINKATCLILILGGSDTTMVTLAWALSLLVNNRHIMETAQAELDIHVGKERCVEISDLKNLVYLQAIVKETLRLYPPTPINGLRASTQDCTLSGYHIPAGTRLMVNTWKIQRDEHVYLNPHEFQPEKFLTTHKDVDVRGQNFELIPFGAGRRSCPAMSLALQVVQYTLARVLQYFEIARPSSGPVDMTETNGLSNLRATPLEVLITPRLSAGLYGL